MLSMHTGVLGTKGVTPNVALLVSLYTFELSVASLMLAIPRLGDKTNLVSLLPSPLGLLCLTASLLCAASSTVIAQQYAKSRGDGSRQFGLTVMLNLVPVVILLATGELVIRIFSVQTPHGPVFMNVSLLPKNWHDVVARNHQILKRAALEGSYLVYDDLMGWTVGPNRRSADGLNFSSVEGIRSPRPGMAFADLPAGHRIALVGDSYTFGLDVPYEESWGYQLERDLGPDFQILNFGVSGYGLDQAYLRYDRDVRPWQPNIVIFGVFPHDVYRAMTVYTFTSFPYWEYVFAKPRFLVSDEHLSLVNVPPLPPAAILAKGSIRELPFIEHDSGYRQTDWEWRYYHHLYLLRFLISRYPRWEVASTDLSDKAMKSISAELLHAFVRRATAHGSMPIVVYLPARRDFHQPSRDIEEGVKLVHDVLRCAGIEYFDLTPCLLTVSASERFVVTGGHYSAQANAAIAKCLRPVVLSHLAGMKSPKAARHAE